MLKNKVIVLLYSPPADPTQPFSSLPALTAYVRHHGFQVIQRDLAIETLDLFLTPSYLIKADRSAKARAQSELDNSTPEGRAFLEQYHGTEGWKDYLIAHVEEAKQITRSPELFYDLRKYQWAVTVLNLSCELVSLPHYPTRLSCSYCQSNTEFTFSGLWQSTGNVCTNLYYEILKETISPEILAKNPLLIGLSVTYHFQLEPALTLARLLKNAAPEVHVTMGGAIISELESHILNDPGWFLFADSYVIGEGETALLQLARKLQAQQDPKDIPNLICRINGRTFFPNLTWFEDVRKLPEPDFEGLDLKRYLSPEPVLLIASSRGCYYGKCAFCDVSRNTRQKYRAAEKKQLAHYVKRLNLQYGVKHFFFCDDSMSLDRMEEMINLVKDCLPQVTWEAEARFERWLTEHFIKQLKAGGCRQLIFGFESASPRVLQIMRKQNTPENDMRILRECAKQGIAINLQTFIGFPGETREEAMETVNFLIEQQHMIASIGFGAFRLYEGTPVYKYPEQYGVRNIRAPVRDALLSPYEYEVASGLTPKEVQKFVESEIKRLQPIYSRRSYFLGGAAGPHSLLYFSFYSYKAIYQKWEELDTPLWQGNPDINTMVLIRSSDIIIGGSLKNFDLCKIQVLCIQTGSQFELSPIEVNLWELCDGSRTAGEVASLWAKGQGSNLEEQIGLLARAFATIVEFLRKGLLVEACNDNHN